MGIVIANTIDYDNELYNHINSPSYKEISENEYNDNNLNFHYSTAATLKGLYNPTSAKYKFIMNITPANCKAAVPYLLWKMHKATRCARMILPAPGTITNNLSMFLHETLSVVLPRISTLCKDTISLIRDLESSILPIDCLLSCMDITALYPNIPISEGIKAVKTVLEEHPDLFNPDDNMRLLRLLELVLRYNMFKVNGKYYQQLIGTAMGTPVAVTFAVIYMYILERDLVDKYKKKGMLYKYLRYIDDMLAAFASKKAAKAFWTEFNALAPTINATGDVATDSVDFLDLTIYKADRFNTDHRLDFKLFQKKLNAWQYIPYSSFHPMASKTGMISGELQRYVKNNTDINNFIINRQAFYKRLYERGYPFNFLDYHFKKVSYDDRDRLLQQQPNKEKQLSTSFVVPYTQTSKDMDINSILREHWHLINDDPSINTIDKFWRPPLLSWSATRKLGAEIRAAKKTR